MQQLLGYPVMVTGMVSLPRAIGNIATVMIAGQLAGKVDPRILIVTGMGLMVSSFWVLSGTSLETGQSTMALISLLQGLGSGLLFLPLMLVVFATITYADGKHKFGKAPMTGEQTYKAVCVTCHGHGLAGAPRAGNRHAWTPLIAEGYDELVGSALTGVPRFDTAPSPAGT